MSCDDVVARWIVSGRVQGVGFRWFVAQCAGRLGIVGWAKNLPDGRVDVCGVGTSDNLEQLYLQLREGPRFSRVENVEKCNCPHEVDSFKSFEIR